MAERPLFFLELLPRLHDLRAHTGRPHWLIVDEAHHLLPPSWEPNLTAVESLQRTVFITVHPDQILPAALRSVGIVLAVGRAPGETFSLFSKPIRRSAPPQWEAVDAEDGVAVLWPLAAGGKPYAVQIAPSRMEHQRHMRKYALGELPPDRSFYFRGPEGAAQPASAKLAGFSPIGGRGRCGDLDCIISARATIPAGFAFALRMSSWLATRKRSSGRRTYRPMKVATRVRELIDRYYVPSTAPALPMPGTCLRTVANDGASKDDDAHSAGGRRSGRNAVPLVNRKPFRSTIDPTCGRLLNLPLPSMVDETWAMFVLAPAALGTGHATRLLGKQKRTLFQYVSEELP